MYAGQVTSEWLMMSKVAVLLFLLAVHLLSMGTLGDLCVRTGDGGIAWFLADRPHEVPSCRTPEAA
jgi:hypothetical protein